MSNPISFGPAQKATPQETQRYQQLSTLDMPVSYSVFIDNAGMFFTTKGSARSDFDGDGAADFYECAFGSSNDSYYPPWVGCDIWRRNGWSSLMRWWNNSSPDASFSQRELRSGCKDIKVGDIDGDGDTDIAFRQRDDSIFVFHNISRK